MTERKVKQLVGAMAVSEGAGVTVHRSIGLPALRHLDPFLMLDHFSSDDPDDYIAGFPDHPHRGFITFTYMLAGRMEHRDSMGNSGVITADVRDQITLCNRAAEAILGHTAVEIIGHPLNEVLPVVSKNIAPHLTSVRNTDEPVVGLEISHSLPQRGPVDWRLNLSPLKDANQATQGVAIVLDDMTERKRLEAQRRLFERMVSPAVIEQLNPDSLQLGGTRADIGRRGSDHGQAELRPV